MSSLWASVGLGIFVLIAILAAFAIARKAGKDAVLVAQARADAEAAERVAVAEANAPRTHDDTLRELRDGGKL